jgi:hypothetical protein
MRFRYQFRPRAMNATPWRNLAAAAHYKPDTVMRNVLPRAMHRMADALPRKLAAQEARGDADAVINRANGNLPRPRARVSREGGTRLNGTISFNAARLPQIAARLRRAAL